MRKARKVYFNLASFLYLVFLLAADYKFAERLATLLIHEDLT